MYESEVEIRVRYAETDRMGYCYYGNYAQYFEVARVESLRSLGFSYKKLEDSGILLPVRDFSITYYKPAFYDDLLKIKSQIVELPAFRIKFKYKTYNQNNENINFGETTLVFISNVKNKPVNCPEELITELKPFFYEK